MMRAAGRKGKMRAGRLSEAPDHAAHRSARTRVYYALFTLLRLLTLHCTRKRSVAEVERAHQTEKAQQTTRHGPPRIRRSSWQKGSPPTGISSSGRRASRRSSHRNNLGNGS